MLMLRVVGCASFVPFRRKIARIMSRLLPSNAAYRKIAPEVCVLPDTVQLENVLLQLVGGVVCFSLLGWVLLFT